MTMPDAPDGAFLELSKLLTGFDDLDAVLARPLHDRLSAVFPAEMSQLLKAFSALETKDEASVLSQILKNRATSPTVLALLKEIINIWYLGSFFQPNDHGHDPHGARGKDFSRRLRWAQLRSSESSYRL